MKDWLRAHSHQGYLSWGRRREITGKMETGDGMVSAEISVICGSTILTPNDEIYFGP
jgi:hypothetical protein